MIFATPEGVLAQYDKRHLFAFGGENRRYTAGDDRVIVDYLGWRINLQVCYDLRFPAWCRNRADYDLMLLVANWPAKRVHHWSALLEARAIENQSWVIGVNRVGDDGNGLHYPGCSVVHDPMGASVIELGSEEACQMVQLDRTQWKRRGHSFLSSRMRINSRSGNSLSVRPLAGQSAHDRPTRLKPAGSQADQRSGFSQGEQHFTPGAFTAGKKQRVAFMQFLVRAGRNIRDAPRSISRQTQGRSSGSGVRDVLHHVLQQDGTFSTSAARSLQTRLRSG